MKTQKIIKFSFLSVLIISNISAQETNKKNRCDILYENQALYDSAHSCEMVQYFLNNYSKTIDINFRDSDLGYTTLIQAVRYNRVGVVDILLANGANINICDRNGKTVLMHAIECKRLGIVTKFLSVKNIDITKIDFEGHDAFYYAHELMSKLVGHSWVKAELANIITQMEHIRDNPDEINQKINFENCDYGDLGGVSLGGCAIL